MKTTPDPFFALRTAVREVLESTTVDDARDVYAAIRQAAPGGLGRAEAQDVANEPTVTLLDTMRLAADRDGIARESNRPPRDTVRGQGKPIGKPRGDQKL